MDQEYYIKKWLQGTLSDEEEKLFAQTDTYRELQHMDEALQSFKAPKLNHQELLERINSRKKQSKEIHLDWWKPLLKIAAGLLVVVSVYFLWPDTTQSYEMVATSPGQTTTFNLPDQSQVTLNASSTVSYSEDTWSKQRSLTLNGEAYFKVAKGTQFTVETYEGTVKVLGTEFNVKSRGTYFEVVCYEGLVQVETAELVQELPATHMFRIMNGTVIKDQGLAVKAPSWINQQSSFTSVPYAEVLKELERQYQVSIEASNIDQTSLFTGHFVHNDLELALKSITQPLNIGYEIKDKQTVVLSGEDN